MHAKVQSHLFVFNLATIGAFWHFLDPFGGAILVVVVRFKNLFGTYLCKQSTLVLEVQPYLIVFASATFWVSISLFWALLSYFFCPLGLFLEPNNADLF